MKEIQNERFQSDPACKSDVGDAKPLQQITITNQTCISRNHKHYKKWKIKIPKKKEAKSSKQCFETRTGERTGKGTGRTGHRLNRYRTVMS